MYEIKSTAFIDHQTPLEIPKEPGVWFLTGIVRDNEVKKKRIVLQVAQTKNLSKEINRDVKELTDEPIRLVKKDYINFYGEKCFSYPEILPTSRLAHLYRDIFKKYRELRFHYICSVLEEQKNLEKYIAYKTGALYWVNGGAFKKKQTKERVADLKETYSNQLYDLSKKFSSGLVNVIDNYLQKEGLL